MTSTILASARAGQRWVVRHRLGDGSATDVIGWIRAVDDTAISIQPAGADVVEIAAGSVITARRAPAAAGGGPPRRISAEALERVALPGWLARHEPLGDWTLRSGDGFTGRANSCLAIGDPGMPIEQAAERIVAYAAANAIPPMAQVITDSAPDHALRESGWTDTYVPTDVLAVRLADLLDDHDVDQSVMIMDELEPRWREAYARSRPNDADPADPRADLGREPAAGLRRRTH